MSVTCVPESESAIFSCAPKIRHLIDLVRLEETLDTITESFGDGTLFYEIATGLRLKRTSLATLIS